MPERAVQVPEQVLVVADYERQAESVEVALDALLQADRKIVAAPVAQGIVVSVASAAADRAVVDGSSAVSLTRHAYHDHNEHNISPDRHW